MWRGSGRGESRLPHLASRALPLGSRGLQPAGAPLAAITLLLACSEAGRLDRGSFMDTPFWDSLWGDGRRGRACFLLLCGGYYMFKAKLLFKLKCSGSRVIPGAESFIRNPSERSYCLLASDKVPKKQNIAHRAAGSARSP